MNKLGFGHLGNGITVWDSSRIFHNDYVKVAHINIHRQITYYKGATQLTYEDIQTIEDYSNTKNPTISSSQTNQYVFINKV